MIVDLAGGLARRFFKRDNRSYPRKVQPFRVQWSDGEQPAEEGIGIEISPGGLILATKRRPAGQEITVVASIRKRAVKIRLSILRDSESAQNGEAAFRVAGKIVGIAADDWDLLMRYVNDLPEPANVAAGELEVIRGRDDDAHRLLPIQVQKKLVQMLVANNRIDHVPEGKMPALRMTTMGKTKTADGAIVQRINIHSRRRVDEVTMAYDTQFAIDAEGNVTLIG